MACDSGRTVYTGGEILTMNGANDVVAAIGIEGERIRCNGSKIRKERRFLFLLPFLRVVQHLFDPVFIIRIAQRQG